MNKYLYSKEDIETAKKHFNIIKSISDNKDKNSLVDIKALKNL